MPDSINLQSHKKGLTAWLAILLCAMGIVVIGWLRERYILNFFISESSFLIPRSNPSLESYPLGFNSFFQQLFLDPRWLTTILLNGLMMICSAIIVWKWFGNKSYFWLVIFAYFFLSLLCGVLVGVSLVLKDYELGYGIAQQIKNLLQLPFLLILFIPALTLYEKSMKNDSV